MEDVDTAGLGRTLGVKEAVKHMSPQPAVSGKHKEKKSTSVLHDEEEEEGHGSVSHNLRAVDTRATLAKEPTFKDTITLSGLLNAIDGVASQEGRVLIMVSRISSRAILVLLSEPHANTLA